MTVLKLMQDAAEAFQADQQVAASPYSIEQCGQHVRRSASVFTFGQGLDCAPTVMQRQQAADGKACRGER